MPSKTWPINVNNHVKQSFIPPILVPLIAIYFLGGMAMAGGRVVASLFALQMGASELLVGVLAALYGILPMFFSVAVGRWIDRVGPFAPITIGVSAISVGTILAVVFPHVTILFFMAVLCGIGFNQVVVAGQYAVGQLTNCDPKSRTAHFGWFTLGASAANVIGPIVAGVLVDHASYRVAFMAMAASAACALLCVAANATQINTLHASPRGTVAGYTKPKLWTLVGTPDMLRIYAISTMFSTSWDLFTFLTPILGHRLRFSASIIGIILAAFSVGSFGIRLMMFRISSRFSSWQILRISLVIIVGVYLILPFVHSAILLLSISFVFGLAFGSGQPNVLSLLHATAPSTRGAEAVGLRQVLCNATGVFGPLLFGATVVSFGLLPVFWCLATLMATALPATYGSRAK